MSECPRCELNKLRAANWRAEAYRLAGHDVIERPWVGLTDHECIELMESTHPNNRWPLLQLCEAKLKEKNAAIVATKEESLHPVQVSIEEFMMRVAGNEDMVGKPVIWTQWPKEAKPPKS